MKEYKANQQIFDENFIYTNVFDLINQINKSSISMFCSHDYVSYEITMGSTNKESFNLVNVYINDMQFVEFTLNKFSNFIFDTVSNTILLKTINNDDLLIYLVDNSILKSEFETNNNLFFSSIYYKELYPLYFSPGLQMDCHTVEMAKEISNTAKDITDFNEFNDNKNIDEFIQQSIDNGFKIKFKNTDKFKINIDANNLSKYDDEYNGEIMLSLSADDYDVQYCYKFCDINIIKNCVFKFDKDTSTLTTFGVICIDSMHNSISFASIIELQLYKWYKIMLYFYSILCLNILNSIKNLGIT